MATLSFASLAPVDRITGNRQHVLNCRMRLLACAAAFALAGVICGAVFAYILYGLAASLAWLTATGYATLKALGSVDRHFIAPLQASCQDDFNRHVEVLFGPLLDRHAKRR
jgi:hypothetical protein